MACCGLSPGVALVAATVPAPSSSRRLAHAPVRLPALRTARSLTLSCARGHGSMPVLPWAPSSCDERFTRDQDADKEAAAAPVGAFRPLLDNLKHMLSVRTIFDVEDYHVGMPFGALLACVGLWQVWKMDPSTCLDLVRGAMAGVGDGSLLACMGLWQVWKMDPSTCLDLVLAYAFYKLSVLAADVRKRGFCNDLITRVQLVIALTMAFKDIHKSIVPLDYIRVPVFFLYTVSVLVDLSGMKKLVNPLLNFLLALSKSKPGRRELMRILVFDDFNYIRVLMLCGGGPKTVGVSEAQQMEVNQTLDRLLRLIDEHIETEPQKGVLAAEWLMCQILVLLSRVKGKMLGLKMEGAPDADQWRWTKP
ncbi:hypothetical protein ACQJBY_050312 [Aegilops geniculata]